MPGAGTVVRIGGLVGVAFALRLMQLGYQSVWEDEAYTLALAQRSFGGMLRLFRFEANGLLYSLIVWPLVRIGQSTFVLRSPALVAGVVAVPALWWAGQGLVGRRGALLGAWLLAVSPMAVYYSQEARAYSFVVLLSILAWGCLDRALRAEGRRWWWLYAVTLAVSMYANGLAPLMLAPAQLVLVAAYGRQALRAWALAFVGAAVLSLPIVVLLVVESGHRNPLYWLASPGVGQLLAAVRELVAGGGSGVRITTVTRVAALLFVGIASCVVVLGMRRGPSSAGLRAVCAWALVPLPLAAALSLLHPILLARYQIEALPGIMLALGGLLARMRVRLRTAAFIALGVVSLAAVARQSTVIVKADFRSAASWLAERHQPGDPVLVDPLLRLPGLGYYDPALRAPDGRLVVAEWHDAPLPAGVVGLEDPGGITDAPPGPPTPHDVAVLLRRTGRLFIVSAPTTSRQGPIPTGAALRWAHRHCSVATRPVRLMTVFEISDCRSAATR
ncbi:MAG: glycosyltransferase family 39 protein [Gaiellales bacterium]